MLPEHKAFCFVGGCFAPRAEKAHTPSTNERVPRTPHEIALRPLICRFDVT
jgi:hypothetical protein